MRCKYTAIVAIIYTTPTLPWLNRNKRSFRPSFCPSFCSQYPKPDDDAPAKLDQVKTDVTNGQTTPKPFNPSCPLKRFIEVSTRAPLRDCRPPGTGRSRVYRSAGSMATETPRRSGGLSFDLVSQLSFYGAYHSNKINQLIHFVFVSAPPPPLLTKLPLGSNTEATPSRGAVSGRKAQAASHRLLIVIESAR